MAIHPDEPLPPLQTRESMSATDRIEYDLHNLEVALRAVAEDMEAALNTRDAIPGISQALSFSKGLTPDGYKLLQSVAFMLRRR